MRGQGSLEYLLLIGGGVLVAIVIIGAVLSIPQTAGSANEYGVANAQCTGYPTESMCSPASVTIGTNVYHCVWSGGKCMAGSGNCTNWTGEGGHTCSVSGLEVCTGTDTYATCGQNSSGCFEPGSNQNCPDSGNGAKCYYNVGGTRNCCQNDCTCGNMRVNPRTGQSEFCSPGDSSYPCCYWT